MPVLSTANEADEFVTMARLQFDRLYAEGDRMMCLTVHPALIGQAQRARYLDEIMRYITSFPDVWFATGAEIAEHYMENCYDRVIEKLTAWRQSHGHTGAAA